MIGAQWGDEGKGKIVDVFSANADMVVRFQGGANAGHTLVVAGKKLVLHQVPSGILHGTTQCAISAAVVLDIESLAKEIAGLQAEGFLQDPKQLLISDNCTVILPYHKSLDLAREQALQGDKIGTTGKGIGPAYEDRASRRAIVFADLFDQAVLRKKLERNLEEKNHLLANLYGHNPFSVDQLIDFINPLAQKLEQFRSRDLSHYLHKLLKQNKRVMFEGAQGALLDLWHGTYPFVTSSSTLAGSACVGAGLGPTSIQTVLGIMKAYSTRVGSGPFPTELEDEVGQRIQKVGHEFGSTTGRSRRCGWLDLVALKYSIRLNGITNLALMKLDVLSGLDRIGVCTAYKLRGQEITDFPATPGDLDHVEPVIEYFGGWKEDLTKINNLKDLPRACTNYIDFIGNQLATPIDVISVGPGREQTLWVKPLFTN